MDVEDLGISFSVSDDPELIEYAESLGYETMWISEENYYSAFGRLMRYADVTDSARLATGIVTPYSRTPAAMAQEIGYLDEVSEGRAVLGLGAASPGMIEGGYGVEFDRPVTYIAEYIDLVRRYLARDPEGYDGEFFSPDATDFLSFEPYREDVPIYNGAIGPTNVRMTGAKADGWWPSVYSPGMYEQGEEWLRTGAERAGRDPDDLWTCIDAVAAAHPDGDVARRRAAEHIANYLVGVESFYDDSLANSGFEEQLADFEAADSVEEAAEHMDEDFLEAFAIAGTPEEVEAQIDRRKDLGVDELVLVPAMEAFGNLEREDFEYTIEAFADAV